MNATEYMKHWEERKVWEHLKWPRHQKRFKMIARYCIGDSFLDVGCAYGHSTMHLKKFKPGSWAGCDFAKEAIEKARQLFKTTRFFYCDSYNMFRCISEVFDTAICSEVLEHVEEDKTFATELTRIAKKRIIITTPRIKVDDPGHLRVYSRETLTALFPRKKIVIKEDGPFFYMVIDL